MGFADDYFNELNKKKKKKQPSVTSTNNYATEYHNALQKINEDEKNSALAWRDDEIAPVRDTSGYLQKSAFFDDGYQAGDVVKTAGATLGDVGENAAKGGANWLEKMWDGLLTLGTMQNRTQMMNAAQSEIMVNAITNKKEDASTTLQKYTKIQDDIEKATAEYVAKDIIKEENIDFGVDKYSVLGEKSDALVQSGTEVLAREGVKLIPGIGVPLAYLSTGASVLGGEAENAFREGASFNDAVGSGMISAAGEMGVEALFGIKIGKSTLSDGLVKKLTRTIPSKVASTLAKWGINATGEGVEEVLSGYISAAGQKLTYLDEKEINEIYSSEERWDDFMGGVILGGFFEGVNIPIANKKGIDYVTGLKKSEKAVVDKVYNDAVAEKEKNKGKKLTVKEKTEIFDTVVEKAEKGYISTDTIEEVLGGDEYKAYKDNLDTTSKLKTELEDLSNIERGKLTRNQEKRIEELEAMNLNDTTKSDELRKKLDDKLSPMLNGSKLAESYRETERRKQAFTADLTQYTGKQREAIERAVKSGVLNNTNRSHELVDILSKIEADKGIAFDYTNNEKLKETGFAVEGKTVNGFVKDGGVTLNVQSQKAWQSTVGHEITHVLEGTESYGALREALYAYAESKGELESRRTSLAETYNGMDADIDAELTADLVGDYLFTDKDFINHLTGNRTLFQKVYDEIKYLCKVATGKELTEIEKVKREFDRAWKEQGQLAQNNELDTEFDNDDVNYSISVTDKETLDILDEQVSRGEYNAETNPNGGYYVTYKSMSFWGYDEDGNAILRSPMAEYVDGELSNAYLIPKDKSKLNWYKSTETIDENTGLPSGLLVKAKQEGKKSFSYLPASENQHLINEDWSNLYFNLRKKVQKNGKWVNSDVPARYNPYEHSSNSMLNDQFSAAYLRDNLVTVKMYVPVSEDNGAYRAKWSKDPTGWSDWKTGTVAGKIGKQKDLQRKVYLSRYAAPVEIVPDSEVAQAYKEYLDGTDVTIPDNVVSPNLLNELKKAGVPIEESGKVKYSVSTDSETEKGGVSYDKKTESYSPVRYSLSTWDKSDYVSERSKAASDMAEALGVTEEKASEYIDSVNSIAKMIADDKARLGYEASPGRSAFVSNAEYGGSIDFSTICKKRRLFTGTFEAIQNALPNTALTAEEVLDIRKMMKDKGYEVSCGLCYVEGSRANMGQYTKAFIERYKATNPEYVPNMAEMNTATGQEQIRKDHPEVYEAYEYFMNHYGKLSPDDKALFASQQKPKMYQMATEYKGEILDIFGNKGGSVAEKNKNGGLRLQSFSDFEIIHLLDSMQVIMDMSRVGLAGQAYTKVPDFAWALGDTGLKINLSLIAKDVDANGRLVLDEVEGMKESDAMALRDRYSDNVGTILVAFNDEQLKAAMADERIDYIIPYHRSQWKTSQYESMGLPENTKDYTAWQNESYIEPVYNKNGKKQRPSNYMPNTYWDFNKSGKENAVTYLAMCAENNRRPKFSHLLVDNGDGSYSLQPDGSTDGYWKTLIDFKMYNNDGIGVPQNPVTPDFNMEEAKRMLNEYTGGHAKFPVAQDIVEEFVSKHPDNIAPTAVKRSLSGEGEQFAPIGNYSTPLNETALEQDIAPVAEGVAKNATATNAPVSEDTTFDAPMLENIPVLPDEELEQGTHTAIRPKPEKQPSLKKVNNAESKEHIAQVLTEEPKVEKKKKGIISTAIRNFVDKGAVFENLSLKTKNRALQDTYKAMGRSETKAQYFMENGTEGVKPLNNIIAEVEQTGKTKEFYEYLYHKHNVDRMSLESRERPNLERLTGKMKELKLLHLQENQLRAIASEKITHKTTPERTELVKTVREYLKSKDVKNKPVFDYSVTAEMSQETAKQYEVKNPEFKEYAQDVYDYMNHLRKMMVYNGVISPETAELWAKTYPYYVPIRRVDNNGLAVDVPLDTRRTGINAPIKRATGGNSDILPLFNTMAQRTMQTFKAIDKNRFGIELKDTLGGVTESTTTSLDEVIDSIDAHESLLQEGKNGKNPTFTVFEGGERVTFDITDEMYDALKPTSEGLSYTNKALNTASNLHRGVLTEYSVPFMVTNAIKDAQDVLINSQHATKTYAKFPTAINELRKHGKWYTEYMENGGGDNTYFDKQTNTFNKEKSQLRKIIGFPFDKISDVNNFIEKVPRLAEYIASRESGASIDAAMLDAARVTTDFSAGGDVTKFLNRNGATFLNASVQGFAQQVRNVREAKMNGLKGWLGLATKITLAGLPAMLLNKLLWDDDEEYEELSDYVKENYYVVAKYGDGKFVRIPKGRVAAVIQNGLEQISNTLTGDDEADWGRFAELVVSNLAPNDPSNNNIIAPIKQVITNKTWYGEDLVPSRLQDLPAAEQFDESTDAISKWLGENINVSPYKINYLLNQYSGGIGDIFLPMMTPEAESGDNSLGGNIIAPLKDKFTTDSVMNNQNVSDFYDTVDVLTKNAKSSYATDEDILKNKYINSVNTELGDLYKAKREIQNSNLSDSVKYAQVRSIQDQINNLAKNALNSYEKVNIQGGYATVGDKHYRLDDGVWTKISDKQLERQQEVTNELGISPSEYWSKTDISYFPNSDGEYEYAYDNPDKYAISKIVGGYDTYKTYSKELYNIKSDKDENGKSISGSRKEKVLNYINNLDADYETKIILWKSEYPSDDTYNMEIINYINNRTDLTYEERVSIFTELGFTVSNGSVYWD